jgi:hypothetical protein
MRFHGLMMVRDEADILAETLTHLLTWIDAIYVQDLGSTDETWEIVQDFARRDRRVVPFESRPLIFSDSLRGLLFENYRERFATGDWVLRVDADEFYHVTPPEFVRTRLRRGETCVYLQWYYFRLTSLEVEDYESGRVDIERDRQRPIAERRCWYKLPDYAEPRMFRYRPNIRWSLTPFPYHAGYVARQRLPIRHYPHRDPLQMQRRYRLRAAMMQLQAEAGPHWRSSDWREDVLAIDSTTGAAMEQNLAGRGLAAARGHTAGELYQWQPGQPLPEINTTDHLARGMKRLAQRLIHPCALPLLDRLRPPFPHDFRPQLIPESVQAELRAADHAASR